MTLYEINNELQKAIEDAIDMETGEFVGNTEALESLQLAFDEKVENIGCFIKNLLADAEALKAEKMALAKRQQTAENKAKYLKKYLDYILAGKTYNSPRVAITWRKSEQVKCDDVYAVPDEYLKYKEPELDKVKVKSAIKAGHEVAGCHIEVISNIQVK